MLQPTGMVVRRSKLHPSSTFTMRAGAVACNRLASTMAYVLVRSTFTILVTLIQLSLVISISVTCDILVRFIAIRLLIVQAKRTKEGKFPSLRVPRISLRLLAGGIRLSDRIL